MNLNFKYILFLTCLFLLSCQKNEDVVTEFKHNDTTQVEPSNDNSQSTEIDLFSNNTSNTIKNQNNTVKDNTAEIDIPKPQKINIGYSLEKISSQRIDLENNNTPDFLIFYRAVKASDTTYFLSIYLNNNGKLEDIFYYELPRNLKKIENALYSRDDILTVRFILDSNEKIEEQQFKIMGNKVQKIQ